MSNHLDCSRKADVISTASSIKADESATCDGIITMVKPHTVHGLIGMGGFAPYFALEGLGISLPLIGFTNIDPTYSPDTMTSMLLFFLAIFVTLVCYMEFNEMVGNALFTYYHCASRARFESPWMPLRLHQMCGCSTMPTDQQHSSHRAYLRCHPLLAAQWQRHPDWHRVVLCDPHVHAVGHPRARFPQGAAHAHGLKRARARSTSADNETQKTSRCSIGTN